MSAFRYSPTQGAGGFGWHVADTLREGSPIVAGPFTTREQALAEAVTRNLLGDREPEPERAPDPSAVLWQGIADTLRSLALQADRYDDRLSGHTAAINDLIERVARLEAWMGAPEPGHSVRV